MAAAKPRPRRSTGSKRPKGGKAPSSASKAPRRRFGRKPGRPGVGGVEVAHSCGHMERHALPRISWKREREASYLATRPCTACWSLSQAEEAEAGVGFPLEDLKGTPRQVSWARTLRVQVIAHFNAKAQALDRLMQERGQALASEEYLAIVMPPVLDELRAKFWIENREADPASLLLTFEEMQAVEALWQRGYCPF